MDSSRRDSRSVVHQVAMSTPYLSLNPGTAADVFSWFLPDETSNAQTPVPSMLGHQIPYGGRYTLQRRSTRAGKPINIIVLGCQGGGEQAGVAQLLYRHVVEQRYEPDLVILLGDNFYPKGVTERNDSRFLEQFWDMYLKHPETGKKNRLAKIPFAVILGNHDEVISKHERQPDEQARGEFQIEHTYLPPKAPQSNVISQEKLEFYQRARESGHALSLDELRGWVMPHYYYRFDLGHLNILFLNSNTLAKDYYQYRCHIRAPRQHHDSQRNQYQWLLQQKWTLPGKELLIAIHQGPESAGKRAFAANYDTSYYLNAEELEFYRERGLTGHNDIIKHILFEAARLQEGTQSVTVVCAHDHHGAYYAGPYQRTGYHEPLPPQTTKRSSHSFFSCPPEVEEDTFSVELQQLPASSSFHQLPVLTPFDYVVITAGMGGGKPQSIMSTANAAYRPLYLKKETGGVVALEYPLPSSVPTPSSSTATDLPTFSALPKTVTFVTQEHKYCYELGQRTPMRERAITDPWLQWYVDAAINACREYFDFLAEKQRQYHGYYYRTSSTGFFSTNFSHGVEGIGHACDLLALTQRSRLPEYDEFVAEVESCLRRSGQREHSLATLFNRQLLALQAQLPDARDIVPAMGDWVILERSNEDPASPEITEPAGSTSSMFSCPGC